MTSECLKATIYLLPVLPSQVTVNLCILPLKTAALLNVNWLLVNMCVITLTGNIASGKKEGVITGYYKFREKPAETTTFPIGQILALAISSDRKLLVGCLVGSFDHLYVSSFCMLRLVVAMISWYVFGMLRNFHI